ncbi:hypothetical protein GCM10009116_15670 [Brevundimonas basaltis]|uniref:Uncharacterized protein n=1 Tax=Brevundimonas basaltis TaxID=472166 RepID=A0A7W8MGM6_9CAUL|nr:hypothetical protein [Brevundimonas basaltis]MBB5291121.1 hypothetical protein [Brevundimonas basaltis]
MRRTILSILVAGGCLALGAWTTQVQPGPAAQPAEPVQAAEQQADDSCAPVQATATAHRRRDEARDRGIGRTHTRPKASSARPSTDTECRQSWRMVRRDAQRVQRNAAIDRTLNRGE